VSDELKHCLHPFPVKNVNDVSASLMHWTHAEKSKWTILTCSDRSWVPHRCEVMDTS